MTKRVLASKNVILCRSPMGIGTPLGTFIESRSLNYNIETPFIKKSHISLKEEDDNLIYSQKHHPTLFKTNDKHQVSLDEQSISNIAVASDNRSPLKQKQQPQQKAHHPNSSSLQNEQSEKHKEYYSSQQSARNELLRYQTMQSKIQSANKGSHQRRVNNYNYHVATARLSVQQSEKIFPKSRRSMETSKNNQDTVGSQQSSSVSQFQQQHQQSYTFNDSSQYKITSQANVMVKILQQIEPKRLQKKSTKNNQKILASQNKVQDVNYITLKRNQFNASTINGNQNLNDNTKNRSTSALKNPRVQNRHPYTAKIMQTNLGFQTKTFKQESCLTQRTTTSDKIQANEIQVQYDSLIQKQQKLFSPQQNETKKRDLSSSTKVNEAFVTQQKKAKKQKLEVKADFGLKEINSSQLRHNNSINTQDVENNLFSPLLKQKDEQELNLSYKDFNLPNQVIMMLLQLNFDEYPKYIRLSASWHCCINDALDEYTNGVENQFIQKYIRYLNFLKSSNHATPIEFCGQRGLRLDRIFSCEVGDHPKLINQNFIISYSNEYEKKTNDKEQENLRYSSEYRFDVIKKNQRRITWIHMSDEMQPCSQNEIQVSPGDIIEFSVCLFNMNGVVDLETFNWEDPQIMKIPKTEKDPLSYNRDIKLLQNKNDRKTKVHCNINRICEVEDAVPEWIKLGPERRDQPRFPIETSQYLQRFKVLQVYFNELDIHFNKIVLQAVRKGAVEENIFGNSLQIQINGEDETICNEIKKRGVIFDRNQEKEKIYARIGDIIIVYNSIRFPEALQTEIAFSLQQFQSRTSRAQANQTNNSNTNYNSSASTSVNKQPLTKNN